MKNTDEITHVWIIYSTTPDQETHIPHIVMGMTHQLESYLEMLRASVPNPTGTANIIDAQRLTLPQLKFMNAELDL